MAGPYFVDGAVGNDTNAGTSEGSGNAWATIQKAEDTIAAGEKVWIKASTTYSEDVTLKIVGAATAPIVWEGYTSTTGDGGRATISANAVAINNTIDGENIVGSVGIDFSAVGTISAVAINNIVHDCDTCISAGQDIGELAISRDNLVHPDTGNTDYSAFGTFEGEVTAPPQFLDEITHDYRLSSTSPAKAVGSDAGQTVLGVSYLDTGSHQRQEPAPAGRVVMVG